MERTKDKTDAIFDETIEYEIIERTIKPGNIVCPECGGLTYEGLELCHKCGGILS